MRGAHREGAAPHAARPPALPARRHRGGLRRVGRGRPGVRPRQADGWDGGAGAGEIRGSDGGERGTLERRLPRPLPVRRDARMASAARTAANATGAACWPGSRRHGWCCPGSSAPNGSSTPIC
jgi:hypothetical protein